MKRQRRTHAPEPAYPDLDAVRERRLVLLGIVGLAGLTVIPGCLTTDGDMPGPGERVEAFTVFLPAESQIHTLYYADGGFIDYHVVVIVYGAALATWLEDNRDGLMLALDERLGQEAVTRFAPDEDLSELNAAITQILVDATADGVGAALEDFASVELVVDTYNPEADIDGDIPDSGM